MNEPEPLEVKGQRILTTEQLAEFYGTTAKAISQNFTNNKSKFEKGKHFYLLKGSELKDFKNQFDDFELVAPRSAHLYLWTSRGASRHAKMLGTDQAWDVFDQLEESYFNPQRQLQVPQTLPEALRLAADLADERDQERSGRLIAEQQVGELQPKASYYDRVLANPSLVSISVIAKDYGLSARALNAKLHDLKVQFKQGTTWLLYSKFQTTGWTHSDTKIVKCTDGTEKAVLNTK